MALADDAAHAGHLHDHRATTAAEARLPALAWGLVAATALVVAAAWLVTWGTAADYMALLEAQVAGAAPTQVALYLALSGVMMVAMMLPSALPMVATYRGLARLDAGVAEARVRTVLFGAGYFAVWTAFTGLALVVLMAFGLMGDLGGPARYAPGALLVAAGAYQLTGWKAYCLRHCRTPQGFVMQHWRGGRAGAARMGLAHAFYCLGCCWLLMLVLFVAGAMSVLWMGVFAAFVLVEKTSARGERASQAMGLVALGAGLLALGLAWAAPPSLEGSTAGGMDGMARR